MCQHHMGLYLDKNSMHLYLVDDFGNAVIIYTSNWLIIYNQIKE